MDARRWLVVRFRGGKLETAKVCRTERSRTRIANYLNESAQFYNRTGRFPTEVVGIIDEAKLLAMLAPHEGKPKHQTPEKKKRAAVIRNFKSAPVRTKTQ